jgi:hypothetical protein
VSEPVELHPDGPHSGDYTVRTAWAFAEAVRVLNYATGSHAGQGLPYPATVYDVLGAMKTGAQRLPQLFRQLTEFLDAEQEAGRLADDRGDPVAAVVEAGLHLDDAIRAADGLERAVERAQAAVSGLRRLRAHDTGDNDTGNNCAGDGRVR